MNTIKINGQYTNAVIYTTDNAETAVDPYAVAQVQQLCDFPAAEGTTIRVMPDFHPGKGCVIGLTMTINDKVMPNLVGVDIGCGVSAHKIEKFRPDFKKLDKVIRESVPSGFAIHKKASGGFGALGMDGLRCAKHVDLGRAACSLGTLGGGNHFIEVDRGEDGSYWLVIHSGSRHLGVEICTWYLKSGADALKTQGLDVPYELTWLEGHMAQDYLHDMQLATAFAAANRDAICRAIFGGMGWKHGDELHSVHNYISADNILRKGAIAADARCIIPINMRDGIIIGNGRSNPDWNHSAPHGAGRICSRSKAKETFTLTDFKKTMEGVYSSSLRKDTLDEAPFAYRALDDIREAIGKTVAIEQVLKPIYSFKAGGK